MASKEKLFERRRMRTRYALKKRAGGRPRLSVLRTNKQIYVQLIDDIKGVTLASASSLDKDIIKKIKASGSTIDTASIVGKAIADIAKKNKINEVVFDRGGYRYHGRVKALGDAAREAGLSF